MTTRPQKSTQKSTQKSMQKSPQKLPQRYSARSDGKKSLYDIISIIPDSERAEAEDLLNYLFENEGYGQITLVIVRGELSTLRFEISKKFNSKV